MGYLMLRIIQLKEEYFNGLDKHDLCHIHDSLNKRKRYTSDELIQIMADYTDKKYPKA